MYQDPATHPDNIVNARPLFGPAFFVDARELGYKQPVLIDVGNTGTRYRITIEQLGQEDDVLDAQSYVLELRGWPLHGQTEDRRVKSDYIEDLISLLSRFRALGHPIVEAGVYGGTSVAKDPAYIPFHKDE